MFSKHSRYLLGIALICSREVVSAVNFTGKNQACNRIHSIYVKINGCFLSLLCWRNHEVPSFPTVVNATFISSDSVEVLFQPPLYDGGSPITAYLVCSLSV